MSRFDKFEQKMKDLQEDMKDEFYAEFKLIFAKFPEITYITWNQYTPYFNDGDACVFTVDDFVVTNIDSLDDFNNSYDLSYLKDEYWGLTSYTDKSNKYEQIWSIEKFVQKSGMDMVKTVFDDHVQVIVSRNGIDVVEYDHD